MQKKMSLCQRGKIARRISLFMFSFAVLSLAGWLGCKKPVVDIVEKNAHPIKDSFTRNIFERIYQDEKRRKFIHKISTVYGVIEWDKAMSGKREANLICLLPVRQPGTDSLSALLAIEWGMQCRIKVYDASNLSTVLSLDHRRAAFMVMQYFNFQLSGKQPLAAKGILFKREDTTRSSQPMDIALNHMSSITVTNCYGWMSCIGDGNGNCVSNITYHTECVTSIYWVQEFDYSDEGTYSPYPYNEVGGGGGGQSDQNESLLSPPTLPITNIEAYLSCFNDRQPGTLKIYADQPQVGSDEPFTILGKMGHVFFALEQSTSNGIINRNIGFHPSSSINPFNQTSSYSVLANDQGRKYDVSLTVNLSAEQFSQVLLAVQRYNPYYDLEKYNCTDFTLDVAEAGGLLLPRSSGWWIFGRGRNPGAFGEDLRNQPGVSTSPGLASENSGNCQ